MDREKGQNQRWQGGDGTAEYKGKGGGAGLGWFTSLAHWKPVNQESISNLEICLGVGGWGEIRGQLEGNREGGVYEGVCSLHEAERGRRAEATKGRGDCTLIYYYSPDLQSAWKVSNLLPQALSGNTMVIVGCIQL